MRRTTSWKTTRARLPPARATKKSTATTRMRARAKRKSWRRALRPPLLARLARALVQVPVTMRFLVRAARPDGAVAAAAAAVVAGARAGLSEEAGSDLVGGGRRTYRPAARGHGVRRCGWDSGGRRGAGRGRAAVRRSQGGGAAGGTGEGQGPVDHDAGRAALEILRGQAPGRAVGTFAKSRTGRRAGDSFTASPTKRGA